MSRKSTSGKTDWLQEPRFESIRVESTRFVHIFYPPCLPCLTWQNFRWVGSTFIKKVVAFIACFRLSDSGDERKEKTSFFSSFFARSNFSLAPTIWEPGTRLIYFRSRAHALRTRCCCLTQSHFRSRATTLPVSRSTKTRPDFRWESNRQLPWTNRLSLGVLDILGGGMSQQHIAGTKSQHAHTQENVAGTWLVKVWVLKVWTARGVREHIHPQKNSLKRHFLRSLDRNC